MNPERWGRVKDVFSRAAERPAAEREAWVEQACADDAAVRAEVSRLIAAHEEAGSFIEQPAADLHIGQQPEPRDEMAGRILQQYRLESLVGAGVPGDRPRAWTNGGDHARRPRRPEGSRAAASRGTPRLADAWVVAFVMVLAFAGLWRWPRYTVPSAAPPVRALAVLPFRNLSGDASQDYFADAITEARITSSEERRGCASSRAQPRCGTARPQRPPPRSRGNQASTRSWTGPSFGKAGTCA
jgi:hypothetical protein